MKNWRSILVGPNTSLKDAIVIVDAGCVQIAMVSDPTGRLLGTVGDGDIRRALIAGISLDAKCSEIMNPKPTIALLGSTKENILNLMRKGSFRQVPLVDLNGFISGLVTIDEINGLVENDNWVVLMVGGLGSRLHPLTFDCPKPLLKIGGKPILENIIVGFIQQGFRKFFLSVNYKAEMIVEYFGNGENWGVEIHYLREKQRLGTAGSLSLLPDKPKKSFIIMNGDLLTHADFVNIVSFHEKIDSLATIVVRDHKHIVPYGVVNLDGKYVSGIVEKPEKCYLISSGIYVMSPDSLAMVKENEYLDMPGFMSYVLSKGLKVSAYKSSDYWIDIGRMDEFERAQKEWITI